MSFYVSFYMSFLGIQRNFKRSKSLRSASLHSVIFSTHQRSCYRNNSKSPFCAALFGNKNITVSRDKKARLRLYKNHLPNNHKSRQKITSTANQTPGFSAPTKNTIKTFNAKRRKNPGNPPIANRYLYRHDKTQAMGNINPTPTQPRATHKSSELRQWCGGCLYKSLPPAAGFPRSQEEIGWVCSHLYLGRRKPFINGSMGEEQPTPRGRVL